MVAISYILCYTGIKYCPLYWSIADESVSICTFFGHRDAPSEIEPLIKIAISNLIDAHNVSEFLVGNNGSFDLMVIRCLKKLIPLYPHIKVKIVLAYIPTEDKNFPFDTLYPEGLELSPKKFAISKRNYWMLNKAAHVITFVSKPYGGAAKFSAIAVQKRKNVINLYNIYLK